MKRTFYLAVTLLTILCLALPAMSIAKSSRGSGKGYSSDRSMDRQNYRQEQNMNRYQYQNEHRYQQQDTGKGEMTRERKQNRLYQPQEPQRNQVRDPATHVPDEGIVE